MRLQAFVMSFLISLPFWWGLNTLGFHLEDSFFWQEISVNPEILAAQTNQEVLALKLRNLKKFQDNNDLKLTASSALVLAVSRNGPTNQNERQILFRKQIDKKLPIASLTKLVTAIVVLENYSDSQEVEITESAVARDGDIGKFKPGEKFLAKDLLYSLLMESSNDAAFALAEVIGQEEFVALMNQTAERLGLKNTFFINPSGLDPEMPDKENLPTPYVNGLSTAAAAANVLQNYSTARDLAKLTIYLLEKHSSLWSILSAGQHDLLRSDGSLHHQVKTTNQLLGQIPGIVGAKTGYTEFAKGCFILVLKNPKTDGYLINIILGSEDKFGEMKKLINWVNQNLEL